MTLSEKQATVHINKILAAKRQLGAAIRLYFIEEDELAIHTIAATRVMFTGKTRLEQEFPWTR